MRRFSSFKSKYSYWDHIFVLIKILPIFFFQRLTQICGSGTTGFCFILCRNFYCVPVSVTSQLKVVMVPVFDAAVSVRVAWVDAPAARTVFPLFQVNVRDEPAPVGVQLFVVIVSVSGTLPVFLMYTVCVAVPPGLSVPTLRDVTVWVQLLSEKTPKLTAFIVPVRGTV
jgi:hypothetical protein